MTSERNCSRLLQKQINLLGPKYQGVRIENPLAIIPIRLGLDNNETTQEPRLWLGTENDYKLLLSSDWLLVDIEDKSRLIHSGEQFFNNFNCLSDENIDLKYKEIVLNISPLAENLRMLIPREIALQIGMSRLTDLGKVTQTNYVSTYTISKLVQHIIHADSCVLYQNGQAYEVQHFLNSPQFRQTLPIYHYFTSESQLTPHRVTSTIKLPFTTICTHKKLVFTLFICRIVFACICQKFAIFSS